MSNPAAADATEGARAEQQHAGAPVPDRKRVLVLASTFPRWTDDTEPPFVYNLCRSLQDDFDITVLAPHARGSKTAERWEGLEIRRFRYFWPERWQRLAYGGILPNLKRNPLLWAQVPFFLAAELISALRLIRAERPDVIHAHWLLPQGLVGAMLNWITGVPVLVTAHGSDVYAVRGRVQQWLKRWALKRVRYVTAVSFSLLREICALGLGRDVKADVISMGIDTRRFDPSKRREGLIVELRADRPLVLFVGRLYEQKGVRYVLEAMPAVLDKHPQATLVIVGDGPLRGELGARAQALGIAGRTRFLGALPSAELPAYYATADVFVAPSIIGPSGDREAFGLVYAEAMASGCPVIGCDVGGTKELIIENKTGMLVRQKDAQALSDAICEVLADAELRDRIRDKALSWVRNRFDQATVGQRYSEVLKKVAA
jgi:glycosyltransferase involved in cell wall biosynthesis